MSKDDPLTKEELDRVGKGFLVAFFIIAVAFIVASVWYYHHTDRNGYLTLNLLPGNFTVVGAVADGDVIETDTNRFQNLANGNETYVSRSGKIVSYYVKVNNVGHRLNLVLGNGGWEEREANITNEQLQYGGQIHTSYEELDITLLIFIDFIALFALAYIFALLLMVLESSVNENGKGIAPVTG